VNDDQTSLELAPTEPIDLSMLLEIDAA